MALSLDDVAIASSEPRRALPEPFFLVVFGASGDLAHRKLMPALLALDVAGRLPEPARVIGFARSDMTDEAFRDSVRRALAGADGAAWRRFAARLSYHRGQYDSEGDFRSLCGRIGQMAEQAGVPANCLFYLATPPGMFVPILRGLGACGLARKHAEGSPWSRIILEKPFGRDLDSARSLNRQVRECFAERQVFRIDHYLGKETVQNLMVLRFANSIFEPIWHQKYLYCNRFRILRNTW